MKKLFALALIFLASCAAGNNTGLLDFNRPKALYVATVIYDLCMEFNCSVTSWIRTPNRNSLVGGVPNSKHLKGYAVDVVLDSNTNRDLFLRSVKEKKLKYLVEEDHIHIYWEKP